MLMNFKSIFLRTINVRIFQKNFFENKNFFFIMMAINFVLNSIKLNGRIKISKYYSNQ